MLLVASYPDSLLSAWIAASKDHHDGAGYIHQVGACSVGLRLSGVASDTLRRSMVLVSAHSNPAHHPATSVSVPFGFNLIGGGARANYSADGQLLTSSFPDGFQWVAASKDHLSSDIGTVDAFAIGLTSGVIPGFGSSIDVFANRTFSFVSTSYGTTALNTPSGWVLASVGGDAQYGGNGRMLTDIIPFVDAYVQLARGRRGPLQGPREPRRRQHVRVPHFDPPALIETARCRTLQPIKTSVMGTSPGLLARTLSCTSQRAMTGSADRDDAHQNGRSWLQG